VQRIRRLVALVLFGLAASSVISDPASRRWRAAELLLALSDSDAAPGATVIEQERWLPGRHGPIRARIYRLAGTGRGSGLVLSHGVHHRGIDERRLVPFARELARAGLVVLTPELDDLTDYRITRRGLEVVTDSARWLSGQPALVSSARVGLLGFSFAGGLSLIAAAEPELEGRLAYVTSVGGHHDLARVLRFLISDRIETPRGARRSKAHEYGLIVLLYQNLEAFVPEPDLPLMRQVVRAWLQEERERAIALASLRTQPESEALFARIEHGRLRELAPELERLLAEHVAELAALSPASRLASISVPVYLLHGTTDSVIPPSENEWASRELGTREHAALVSPLLEHVEVNGTAGLLERALLVDFMARML
jgi:pimeloyl-ACP methyl ester carboxylesterase